MSDLDISSVTSRIFDGFQTDLQLSCAYAAREFAPLVESEIELMLAASLKLWGRLADMPIVIGNEFPAGRNDYILVTPQFPWAGYRIDFCIRYQGNPQKLFFVECDGHNFHERTKEQAERDRSKDRAIQAAGFPILRFTGREIWRDPVKVVHEIMLFMSGGDN